MDSFVNRVLQTWTYDKGCSNNPRIVVINCVLLDLLAKCRASDLMMAPA